MLRIRFSVSLVCVVLLSQAVAILAAPPEGFRSLYNGKTLGGWHTHNPHKKLPADPDKREAALKEMRGDKEKHWRTHHDEIVNDGHGAYLVTDESFGDIEFMIEYKTVARADSGIYMRGTPQVQIWDWTDESKWKIGADKGSGGLWNNPAGAKGKDPLVRADNPFGQWNRFRIIQIGARTTVYLNDKLIVDHALMDNYWNRKAPLAANGPVMLQTHGGEIRWRNVYVREIPPAEANEFLRAKRGTGFKSIFNGKNLSQWTGAVDSYQVVDGAISCKAGKGGVLYTKDQYSDFSASLEFKLPSGGNNGLAIRYPGKGDPAYSAMCELQVLDNTAKKYAKLDARQYHGSIYGMVAAHRGYLRPTGTWNYQEVTVKGSHITVELNGSVIINADISKVKEFMGKRPHPGKELPSGAFGFAGHGDPVEFRNVDIREN